MVAILAEIKGRVLIQFPGMNPVEVGSITIPITATVTPEPVPRESVFEQNRKAIEEQLNDPTLRIDHRRGFIPFRDIPIDQPQAFLSVQDDEDGKGSE